MTRVNAFLLQMGEGLGYSKKNSFDRWDSLAVFADLLSEEWGEAGEAAVRFLLKGRTAPSHHLGINWQGDCFTWWVDPRSTISFLPPEVHRRLQPDHLPSRTAADYRTWEGAMKDFLRAFVEAYSEGWRPEKKEEETCK